MKSAKGTEGAKGYCMTTREAISNAARLSLIGKLNAAIEEHAPDYFLIPYYGAGSKITYEDFSRQINERLRIGQRETLWEKALSILLKNLEKIG